ncbi:hypothetical protein D3C81_1783580 [compost metagenome]
MLKPSSAATNGVIRLTVSTSIRPGMPMVGKISARLNHNSSCKISGVPRNSQVYVTAT